MNKDALVNDAVKCAISHAQVNGLKVGQVVAHPSDPLAYDLIRIEGDMAVVGIPKENSHTGKAVEKNFPLNELFVLKDALDFALTAQDEHYACEFPGAIVVRV